MLPDLHCSSNDVNALKTTIQDMQHQIASLNAEFDSYKNTAEPQSPKQPQTYRISTGATPVCLCGVTNLQEENLRLRHGLVAKHNEVVHLRGLMMNSENIGKQGSRQNHQNSGTHTKSTAMASVVQQMFLDSRLPGGGVCTPCPQNGGMVANGGGAGRSSYGGCDTMGHGMPPQMHPGTGTQTMGGYGMGAGAVPCIVPGCPYGHMGEDRTMDDRGYGKTMGPIAFCDTNQSATTIIVESKRQMEQTENEIKSKLQEIKGKKNELEEDIAKLQEVLLAKEQEASTNMQAARAVKAAEIAQAAQMATELHKQQRAQALAAAKAAAHLQQAQNEQSVKQTMAAKAANAAQQAQNHQLMMASQTVAAAERAEQAQKEQAVQAEEAARAAQAVQAAQEEQNQLANKQLQDAEELKRNQEEQACKTAQATEALHAAHVAQVAQQAQACQATTQAHTVLMQHKYIPPMMGCQELERGMQVNMDGVGGNGGHVSGKCCNPNCPNYK